MKKTYDFDVEIVRRADEIKYSHMPNLKFPAVEIDGEILFEDTQPSMEQLEDIIRQRLNQDKIVFYG